jgi:hypothetical protein
LYYLPAKLTPAQEAFLTRRKEEVCVHPTPPPAFTDFAQVKEAADREWILFKEERAAGIEEINQLRQHAVEEEAKIKIEREAEMETDTQPPAVQEKPISPPPAATADAIMDVDEAPAKRGEEPETNSSPKKEESVPVQADDDEAVEY